VLGKNPLSILVAHREPPTLEDRLAAGAPGPGRDRRGARRPVDRPRRRRLAAPPGRLPGRGPVRPGAAEGPRPARGRRGHRSGGRTKGPARAAPSSAGSGRRGESAAGRPDHVPALVALADAEREAGDVAAAVAAARRAHRLHPDATAAVALAQALAAAGDTEAGRAQGQPAHRQHRVGNVGGELGQNRRRVAPAAVLEGQGVLDQRLARLRRGEQDPGGEDVQVRVARVERQRPPSAASRPARSQLGGRAQKLGAAQAERGDEQCGVGGATCREHRGSQHE
jgi:hypothetical protein